MKFTKATTRRVYSACLAVSGIPQRSLAIEVVKCYRPRQQRVYTTEAGYNMLLWPKYSEEYAMAMANLDFLEGCDIAENESGLVALDCYCYAGNIVWSIVDVLLDRRGHVLCAESDHDRFDRRVQTIDLALRLGLDLDTPEGIVRDYAKEQGLLAE